MLYNKNKNCFSSSSNCCCDKKLIDSFYSYASNYKTAADIISKSILGKNNIYLLDGCFPSIVFLYRHSLECLLKAIAFTYIDNPGVFITDCNHNLHDMLLKVKKNINNIVMKDKDMYKWTNEFISNLSEIDKDSDSFRYPFRVSKTENKKYRLIFLFDKESHINLLELVNKFKIAFYILDSYFKNETLDTKIYVNYTTDILQQGGSYYYKSVIYDDDIGKYYAFIKAYKVAADILIKNLYKDDTSKELYLPICYLFRNSIELELKRIYIKYCEGDLQNKLKKLGKKKHSLLGIWNLIEGMLETIDTKSLHSCKPYIEYFHNYDINADKFRYPIDKYINYYFDSQPSFDTLKDTINKFKELYNILDYIEDSIYNYNEIIMENTYEY